MKPQVLDIAVRVLPAGLPVLVRDLSFESNRPVIDPARLFFREAKPTFKIPEIELKMAWSPLLQQNPAHQWLRRLITEVAHSLV